VSAAVAAPRLDASRIVRRHAWTAAVYVLLLALLVLAKGAHSSFGAFDIQSLALGALPLALAAAAQAVVVIGGGIDLSVGPLMAVANVVAARTMEGRSLGVALAFAALILVGGVAAGAVNGLLITLSRVPDIVVTLAMSFVWGGVALEILENPGGGAPADFLSLAGGKTISAWVPNALIFLVVCIAVVWIPLRRSRAGLAIYAIGSDRVAAFRSGVAVGRTKVASYAIDGLFCAMGGLALMATTGIGDPLSGALYTLSGVSAIVLGGVNLAGGRGGMLGPVAAAFVLTLLPTVLIFLGVDANYSQVIQGAMLVLVVMVGGLAALRRERA
jgi:ribose transport system permease protein